MFPYLEESFTDEEADILRRYVTTLDGPVFALVNLPEVVKGALFARYSRSAKTLRRLFLDEFVGDLELSGDAGVDATIGLRRAEELYDRVFMEYGDDSVAQLGGVHLACEQASNLLTKVLEWGRLMAYLEQSTRYVAYDSRLSTGRYRYYRDPEVLDSPYGARYVGEMDRMFEAYGELLPVMQAWLTRRFPRSSGDSDFVHRQSIKAKALDSLRGLLPTASISNVGIYGTGQSYEQLILRMRAHPLPEARRYAEMMLEELRKVIPSFLQRLDRPERGGAWAAYLASTRSETQSVVERLWPDAHDETQSDAPLVRLVDHDPQGEDKVLAAMCFSSSSLEESELLRRVERLSSTERLAIASAYVGDRTNRRHRPGRALERTSYRFEIVSDYGAFRDLQRHRMLTVEWQPLTPDLGYELPESVAEAGLEDRFEDSMARSANLYHDLQTAFPDRAAYALTLAHRLRYVLDMNAREAMHLIELRSGTQGHPVYRRVAQEMHRLIAEQAGHRIIAQAMAFVDNSVPDLERLEAERRTESRRLGAGVVVGDTLDETREAQLSCDAAPGN
ncbi:MAG: FAD-dependent thymidylate synthase [Acidimicrobiales bacterium]